MKISLEWLADFLDNVPTADAAAEALTHGGLPVETIERVGDDTVIDVEVTSNRSDCLSHRGVARELAALLDLPFHFNPPRPRESEAHRTSAAVRLHVDAENLCPHYTARIIRGVKIAPSPAWLVRRLEAMGLRAVNNVVDVTNYVMFELGQPLHAFDFDCIGGHERSEREEGMGAASVREVRVREASAGESIISIDGHERKLSPGMLVIADADRPIALAGVMGGRDSEVSDATTTVLLESARFDPLSVRKTARSLSMKSDSSYRYERGIDPQLPTLASLRAAELILQTAGGELLGGVVEAGAAGGGDKTVTLRADRLQRLLGMVVEPARVTAALRRDGFEPEFDGKRWTVAVPSGRLDVNAEIDLIEEVVRVIGYQNIPVRDKLTIRVTPADPPRATLQKIRRLLAACGYSEAITFSFVTDALAGAFAMPGESLMRVSATVRKADAQLRPSLLPGLLEAVRRNESVGTSGAKLFEIGSRFWIDRAGVETERVALSLVGGDVRDVRGAVETITAALDGKRPLVVTPEQHAGFAPAGRIEWGGERLGTLGVVDREVQSIIGLRQTPSAAELDFETLLTGAGSERLLEALPRFPAIKRDLSLIVAESVSYADIAAALDGSRMEHVEQVHYVTTYRGKPLEKGTKSVTIQLSFRSPIQTLTAEAVDASVTRAVDAVTDQLAAIVRS